MTSVETIEPTTTTEKFDLLLKDYTAHLDAAKTLVSRMKALQKEVAKATKSTKRRATKSISDDSDSDTPRRPSALQKPVKISDELCTFLGFEVGTEHSRQEVTTTINKYVKDNDLQDPTNRRYIRLDCSKAAYDLKALLRDPDQPLTFFNIQRYLKPHYPQKAGTETKSAPVVEEPTPEVVPDAAVVDETPKEEKPAPKRRVVRRT
jgi:chromatin remodeling complex protein RSC6